MATRLTLAYDREADILHIDACPPYSAQDSEEMANEMVARLNPRTGEIENLDVLFFSTRLLRGDVLELPVTGSLRLVTTKGAKSITGSTRRADLARSSSTTA